MRLWPSMGGEKMQWKESLGGSMSVKQKLYSYFLGRKVERRLKVDHCGVCVEQVGCDSIHYTTCQRRVYYEHYSLI